MQMLEYQCDNFYSKMNGKELKQLRVQKGLSQQRLADLSGIPLGTIGRIESSGEEIKKIQTADLLQKVFNNEEIRGNISSKTPMGNAIKIGELTGDEENSPFIDIGNGQYIMVVPIVPIKAQAGYIQNYNDEKYIEENFTEKHTFSVSRVYRGRYMAFIVDGDSMDDRTSDAIIEGSTVTGREIQKHHWRNKFHINRYKDYVIVHSDAIFVKRIIEHDTINGTILCHSLNPNKDLYADFELNLDECLQIFNVVNVTQTR